VNKRIPGKAFGDLGSPEPSWSQWDALASNDGGGFHGGGGFREARDFTAVVAKK